MRTIIKNPNNVLSESPIFASTRGFQNNITPLDASNLNPILSAIRANDSNISALTKEINTVNEEIYSQLDGISDKTSALEGNVNTLSGNLANLNDYATGINNNVNNLNDDVYKINNALDNLADKDVIKSNPSVSIKWRNGNTVIANNNSGVKLECGQRLELIGEFTNYIDGKYKYPLPNGTNMGCNFTTGKIVFEDIDINVTFNNNTAVSETLPSITIEEDDQYIVYAAANYGASDIIPINNLGLEYPAGKKGAGSSTYTLGILGYLQGCFCGTVSNGSTTLNSEIIRGLNTKLNSYYTPNTTLNMVVPVGATSIIIACPANTAGPKSIYNSTVNAEMLANFTKVENVSVKDAGTNNHNYNVWIYTPNSAYTQTADLKITLG